MSAPQPLSDVQKSISEAAEKTGRGDWTAAAEIYQRVLLQLDKNKEAEQAGATSELLGESYFKAAFQSTSRKDFLKIMHISIAAHEDAANFYRKIGYEALASRSQAKALFSKYWTLETPDEKRAVLAEAIPLAQSSAQNFEVQRDRKHLAEALLDLLVYRERAVHLSRGRKELVDAFDSAVETAWRIIEEDNLADSQTVLETVSLLTQLYLAADYVLEKPRYEELERKLARLKDRIPQLSREIGTVSADALAGEAAMNLACDLEGDFSKTFSLFDKTLPQAQAIGDHYMIGRMSIVAGAMARWAGLGEEYVERRREQLEKAIRLAESSNENLKPSSPGPSLKRASGVKVDASNYLALTVETDIDKKRATLRKAINETREAMVYERESFMTGVGHQLSRSMYLLATMDVGPEEKRRLLTEALPIREDTVATFKLLSPHSWSYGLVLNYLALIKAELAKVESDPKLRVDLVKSAASDMETCVKLCSNLAGIVSWVPGKMRMLAQFNEWQGDVLQQVHQATMETSTGREAVEAYKESIANLSKAGSLGPIPTVRWKIAESLDELKEYSDSSESFRHAAQEYRMAGKKLTGLSEVFEDYARYMDTWAIIEEARSSHEREQYTAAAEAYSKAASILRTLKNWGSVSKHYSACSFLELGESMSRQGRQQAAIESFNTAKANLSETIADLEQKVGASSPQEKRELTDWLDVSRGRLKYSSARLQLEEAKVLDARMEEEASSTKYRLASEAFRKLMEETRHRPTRAELETLGTLCDAWSKMKSAEVNASPELYAEAAASFQLVEIQLASKKTRRAAMANASMCKALEAGCQFRRTRNPQLYQTIKTNLESAADFYEEAGIRKAADWTRATQRYFDALTYLREAEVETEPKKRAELFHLAENHLQLAATIYGEAGYASKRQESLRHLERAREEKQLLLMPVEVLAESPTVADVAITPMSLAEEKAVGLEKLEDAHVVGTLTFSSIDVNAGERVIMNMQMVNLGRTPATLERIVGLPTQGLKVVSEKGEFSMDDHGINLRGRRLEHMKSYEMKIPLKSLRKGAHQIAPEVVFFNEKGQSSSYKFEPTIVQVKEIGVLGWIRGPS